MRSGSILITLLAKAYTGTLLMELVLQKTQFMHLTGVFGLTIDDTSIFQEDENEKLHL